MERRVPMLALLAGIVAALCAMIAIISDYSSFLLMGSPAGQEANLIRLVFGLASVVLAIATLFLLCAEVGKSARR